MSRTDGGDAVGRFYAAFDRGDLDAGVLLFAEQLEIIDPGMGKVHGRDRFREYLQTLKRALPDAQAVIEHRVDAGDMVVVEGRFVGTYTGPLTTDDGDVEPTGASVDLRFVDLLHVSGGAIISYHTYYDQLDLFTQLGLMASAPSAGSIGHPVPDAAHVVCPARPYAGCRQLSRGRSARRPVPRWGR